MVGAKRITPVINLGGTAGILPPVPFCGREFFIFGMSLRAQAATLAPGASAGERSPIERDMLVEKDSTD